MDNETFRSIMDQAIAAEIEAHEFYKQAAEKVAHPHLKQMFSELAAEELKHKQILEGFRNDDKARLHFGKVPDFKVAQTVETPALSFAMAPADAIALAMKKEEAAMNEYLALAAACDDPAQRQTFEELAAMERQHKAKMEQAYVDIGYPEVW